MLEKLKNDVCKANLDLFNSGVVIYTWGNVSGIDREKGLVVIKPSGIPYEEMKSDDMVVIDLNGNLIEGKWNPSTDTNTHLELYKNFYNIGGVVHTHSTNAVAFAQAGIDIPALGTTHADYFYGAIKCCRSLTEDEVLSNYEKNTGKVIVETLDNDMAIKTPGVLVKGHGPFAWGKDPFEAVYNAVVLEKIAEMALKTFNLNYKVGILEQYILDKHYFRKHGKNAYYGQFNK